jgi:hypothetical protein
MQDELDRVPADAIFYSEAFERVFDALHPNAARLRAEIEQISVMTSANFTNPDKELEGRRHEIFKEWEEARSKTQNFFRNQLAMGELDFYQRDSVTGEKLRLHPDLFLSKYAFNRFSPDPLDPPIFFIKADFETWLENCSKGLASELSPVLGRTKSARKRSGGRTPGYDWIDIEAFVFKKMDANGDFDEGSPGWRGLADLLKLIEEYLQGRNESVPTRSVLYDRVGPMVLRWHGKQSSSGK